MSIEENKKLLAELKEQKATLDSDVKTVSDVATKMQQKAKIKKREVKAFYKNKSDKQIINDSRQIVKQRRAYILRETDSKHADVYNTTTYKNAQNVETQLDFHTMRILAQNYVNTLKRLDTFTIRDMYTHFSIFGSSRSDYPRNATFEISLEVTSKEFHEKFEACVVKAQALKKQCLYYNINEDSRRKTYMFCKI